MQSGRTQCLALANRRRLRRALAPLLLRSTTPVFFIFTPDIVHFAPYCIPQGLEGFEPVLVLNSVASDDQAWLQSIHPDRLIVPLRVSLTGNPRSVLAHGTVLDDLFAVVDKPFCIQDPDCFVIDDAFWQRVQLDTGKDFAAGPFVKKPTDHDHVLPDTFFLLFNTGYFKQVCRSYGVSASSTTNLDRLAASTVERVGYGPGEYPEQFKGYFDTLQAFWLLSLAEGYGFRQIPGAGEWVFHIGGTSYLHSSGYDLAHWDYWPLSVIYFNLRLLQLPAGERFRGRFGRIFGRFGSSEHLLVSYPDFRASRRFTEIQTLLSHLVA